MVEKEIKMKPTTGEKIFYAINYFILFIAAISCLFPILHVVALSFSDEHAISSGFVTLFPKGFTLEAYNSLIKGTRVVRAFQNSVVITAVGVFLSMIFTIMAAYPLSRKYFYGCRFFTLAAVFTMMFGGGMIPSYLVVKSLGLINSYGAIWLPGLISTYNMLVMRTFFQNIPEELQEAARIDGCGEWRIIFQIIFPLSLPVIATLSLFYGVGYWNAFMNVLLYINETIKYNLSVLVQQMVRSQSLLAELNRQGIEEDIVVTPESLKAAGIMVMVIPMLIVYPFLQKYFVKGVMLGSIKG